MKQRIEWLDVIKGLGIIAVVLSHLTNGGEPQRILLFSFHMPMFLMISGYLFNPKDNFSVFLKKKAVRLLVPFFICGITDLIILNVEAYLMGWHISPEAMLRGLFFIDGKAMLNVPVWYLAVLFEIEIVYFFLCRLSLRSRLLTALCAALLGCAVTDTGFLGCGIFCLAIVYFILGDAAKRLHFDIDKTTLRKWLCIPAVMAICAAWIYLSLKNDFVEIAEVKHGNSYFLYYIDAILGTAVFWYIAKKLSKIRILQFFGKHSMAVLCSHYYLARKIFPIIFTRLGCENILQTFPGQLAVCAVILLFITVLIWDYIHIENILMIIRYGKRGG
ncbi:MAG: acyltransferase family protein [Candidatus Ornithomonoglobus sp.]